MPVEQMGSIDSVASAVDSSVPDAVEPSAAPGQDGQHVQGETPGNNAPDNAQTAAQIRAATSLGTGSGALLDTLT